MFDQLESYVETDLRIEFERERVSQNRSMRALEDGIMDVVQTALRLYEKQDSYEEEIEGLQQVISDLKAKHD